MTVATANGTTAAASRLEAAVFPLDSFKEAAPHLRRPFTPEAIKFKVQTALGDKGALIVGYIDARLAVERLNLIVPHLWHDHYEPEQKGYKCFLTVDEITREDVGDGFGKAGHSDALKRAAVKFGIGVSLYAIPQTRLWLADGGVEKRGQQIAMTSKGDRQVRDLYAAWLDVKGIDAFGPTLDHGDAEGAQGDFEADAPTMPETPESTPGSDSGPFLLAKDIVDELVAAKKATGADDEWVRQQLVAVGLSSVPSGKVTLKTIRSLTEQQAMKLLERFEVVIDAQDGAAMAATELGS